MADSRMGLFRVPIDVASRAGGPFQRIEALVDTGSMYTWMASDLLEALGVTPEDERVSVLADGRERHYRMGWAYTRVAGKNPRPTIVVFGEPGSEALLGVFTLTGFGLGADPVNHRLIPVPGLLKSA
jgi:predicted aspartyl protease